jgi:hypothetical protein
LPVADGAAGARALREEEVFIQVPCGDSEVSRVFSQQGSCSKGASVVGPALKNRRKSPERGSPPSPCHPEEVTETVLLANSKLMDSLPMIDLLGTFSP